MAKMKLAQTSECAPSFVQLTGKLQSLTPVTSISLLNATLSNFLYVFFMRPAKRMRLKFIKLLIFLYG